MIAKNKIHKVSTTRILKHPIKINSPDPNDNYNIIKKIDIKSDELMKNASLPNKLKIKKTKVHSISIDNKSNIKNKDKKFSDTNENILIKKNAFSDKYQYIEDNNKFNYLSINTFETNQLNNFLAKNNLKQTIIIDNEGNNNLNLLLNNKNNNMKVEEKSETTSLFTDSAFQNKEENKNNVIITEKETINDEKRITQYFQIFNLLNDNIEQFKQIFNKENNINININNINEDSIIISGDSKIDTIIRNNINFKNNFVDNNKLNTQIFKNISKINFTNNIKQNNSSTLSYNFSLDRNNEFNSSFVDSSLQNDVLNSLIETKKNFYDESIKINFESINKELEPESEYHIEKKITKNKTLNPHFISNFNINEKYKQIESKNPQECKIF